MKPWCSLAALLSDALVTASVPAGRRLFAVGLRHAGVRVSTGGWHARGLVDVASGPVEFHRVPVRPVGGPDWYLSRPGFAYGGIGVAACWYGGATAVPGRCGGLRTIVLRINSPTGTLGELDLDLSVAGLCLRESARLIDAVASAGRCK
jgi:hypothetical protein